MCYYTSQKANPRDLGQRFEATVHTPDDLIYSEFINGFDYKALPLILDSTPDIITNNYNWGLVPEGKPIDVRKNLLNARVETIKTKASFIPSIHKRCIVCLTGYYDWRWEDEKGKKKTKYLISSQEDEIFGLAGIYSSWERNGEQFNTFSIVTTEGNDTMRYVHNRRAADNEYRMPVMLVKGREREWFDYKSEILDFAYPNYKPSLIAIAV